VAGAASFLAPCCIGMLPAYFGFLLSSVGDGQPKARSLVRGTLLMATGVLAVYAVLAILIAAAGAWLRPWIPYLAPTLALLLIVSAIGMLAGFDWTRLALFRRRGNPAGFFGFGLAYGLAAFGCTGPAFLPIMGSAFLQGATRGGAAFAAFASAIVLFLAGTAALVAAGNQAIWKRFMTHAKAIQRVSAVLMLMGGAYVLWFYARTLS
jgi:cytochrome c biogenesis protein CcdA